MRLSDAVNKIARLARPVLCLDTCIYLDILRSSASAQQILNVLERYEKLLAQDAFIPIAPSIIAQEYARNVEHVTNSIRKSIDKTVKEWNGLLPLMSVVSGSAAIPTMDRTVAMKAIDHLNAKSESLLHAALPIEPDSQIESSVSRRQSMSIRPAKRGKDSFGDCMICETVLALTAALRSIGFGQDVYLVTSNKEDFGDERPGMQGRAHPDLVRDFATNSISYEPVLAAMLWRAFP